MSQLLVFGVDGPQTAEKVFGLADELNRQQLLELADAAWVERDADGKVTHVGIFAAVPYCIDLIGGPYAETDESVIKAWRPKTAIRK